MQLRTQKYETQQHSIKYRFHPIRKIIVGGIILGLCISAVGASIFFSDVSHAPKINHSALSTDDSTKIYDANGHLMSKLGMENRTYIKYKDIPKQTQNALTSIEDKTFYTNDGIEPKRILSAAGHDVTGGNTQGASTLTQQLVKLSVFNTLNSDKTLRRKAQEAWLAMKITHNIPKQKILEYYMNKIYMGYNTYGFATAAHYYYNKPLSKLSLDQNAMLAGMPQSAIQYNPYLHPQAARQRRGQVLQAMVQNHKISQQQATKAQQVPINNGLVSLHQVSQEQKERQAHEKVVDAYIKASLQQLHQMGYRQNAGLKIYTNLSPTNQKKMYNLANNDKSVGFPDKDMQIGGALVNAKNGKVNAMIGGRQGALDQPFGLDRAMQTGRSSGSTSKPFEDYAPAFQDLGWGTGHTVFDTPFSYGGSTALYDWDHRYDGAESASSALIRSRNIPAVRTLQNVGLSRARSFLHGFDYDPGKVYSLQNAINLPISPLQESEIYATFSNGGIYHKPQFINKVVEPNGTVHKYGTPKGRRVMSPAVAYMITHILKKVPMRQDGDPNARIKGFDDSAGKSGTTQYAEDAPYKGNLPDYAAMDSWYTGYTPNYSLSLWTGYDNPMITGHYVSAHGINIVQYFYAKMMKYAMDQKGVHDSGWHQPKDVRYSNNAGYYAK